jgi:hypothetical protein
MEMSQLCVTCSRFYTGISRYYKLVTAKFSGMLVFMCITVIYMPTISEFLTIDMLKVPLCRSASHSSVSAVYDHPCTMLVTVVV